MTNLSLKFLNGMPLKIEENYYAKKREELETFVESEPHLCSSLFAKDVMFSHELKANNQIEGYSDDVNLIEDVIAKKYHGKDIKKVKRIMNLYYGYNYILNNSNINEDSLKTLYDILSKDLLEEKDAVRMGTYYRTAPVYIVKGGIISKSVDELDKGIPENRIDEFMQAYFDFLNNNEFNMNMTDEYIKSQILHFYFVYIHPYFDVNGRTSRTVAMWYLLNKKAYPYIIFNRGITFKGRDYDNAIEDTIKNRNISYFIYYMLKTVQTELEKEYIMECIAKSTSSKLTAEDYQTLLYLLSMNGLLTVKDYASMYNRFHDTKRCKEIYETMIDPLISKDILKVVKTTNKFMFDNIPNEVLEFNPSCMQYDKNKIKSLVRYR